MKPIVSYDKFLKTTRKRYSLDSIGLIFISAFFNDDGELVKYSVDVEKANDSHYEFEAKSGYKLYEIFCAKGFTESSDKMTPDQRLASVLKAFISKGNGEADIVNILNEYQIKYQPFHFDSY